MTTPQLTGNYDFTKDLVTAKTTEQEISALLFEHHNIKTIGFSKDKDYDLLVQLSNNYFGQSEQLLIEIKEDFQCGRTGNMAVEFSSWERPAGIMTTKATHYIHKFHERNITYWLTKTSSLKWMIENKMYHRIVNGGDKGSNSMNYLFSLDVFKKYSRQLFV